MWVVSLPNKEEGGLGWVVHTSVLYLVLAPWSALGSSAGNYCVGQLGDHMNGARARAEE